MELKAGQFNEKLLTTASQVVKNGTISEKDLAALTAAAQSDDGQISDAERLLIANLDKKQVQDALKDAVSSKGLLFKKFEFNQEVVFQLDDSDKTLQVGNRTVDVSQLENQPAPAPLWDIGRKRENYLARQQQEHQEMPQIRFGIKSIDQGTAQSAQDVHDLLQRYKPGQGGPGQVDAAQIQQMDLQKDLNLTYMLVMTKASQMADTQDPLAKTQLGDFEKLLKQQHRGKSPDAAEQQLLQAFGLEYNQGKLVNAANKQEVSPAQLEDLQKTVHAANKAGHTRGRVWEENKDAKILVANLNVTQDALNQLEEARKSYLTAEQGVVTARETLEATTSDVEAKTQVAQQQQQQIHQSEEVYQVLTQALEGADQGNLEKALLHLKDMSPAQLASLNQLLSKYQLELGLDPQTHGLRFVKAGKPVSGPEFFQGIQASLPQVRKDLEAQRTAFVQAQADLQASTAKQAQAQAGLLNATAAFQQAAQNYDAAQNRANLAMASSTAMMNDPAVRALVPPEMLERYHQLRARYEADNQAHAADLSRRQPLLDSVQHSLSRAERAQANARAVIASMNQMLAELDRSFAAIDARLRELSTSQQEGATQTEALIEQADQLEAQLNLMPAPIYQGVEQLADQFAQLLSESQAHFGQLAHSADSQAGFASNLTRANSDKLVRELKHHEQALKQLDRHNKELVARYLAQNLPAFQQLLQAALMPASD